MVRFPLAWLASLLLVAPAMLCCCGCSRRSREPEVARPEPTLASFVAALEDGDAAAAARLVVSEQRDRFARVLQKLTKDDVTATGLQFRQEDYRLDEQSGEMAVFWSEPAKTFLILRLDDGAWRVDPQRTDEMNTTETADPAATPDDDVPATDPDEAESDSDSASDPDEAQDQIEPR